MRNTRTTISESSVMGPSDCCNHNYCIVSMYLPEIFEGSKRIAVSLLLYVLPFRERRVDRSCIRRQLSGVTSWHGVSCLHRYVMPRPPIEARAWYHVIATVLASDSGRSCNWLVIAVFFLFGQYYRYNIPKGWFLISYNCFWSIFVFNLGRTKRIISYRGYDIVLVEHHFF